MLHDNQINPVNKCKKVGVEARTSSGRKLANNKSSFL